MSGTIAPRWWLPCGRSRDSGERGCCGGPSVGRRILSVTLFDDLNAIRSFAGSDYETAVVAGEARSMLIRFDERVCHYETAVEA